MCAVIIVSVPASIAAANGGRSSCSHCWRLWWMTGMAVGLGVAVAREVLRGRRDLRVTLVAEHARLRHPGGQRGVGGERPDADHRVERVDVDVGHRGEVLVDAEGLELAADDLRRGAGVGVTAARAERHVAGEGRRGRAHPGHQAALLVRADQQRDLRLRAERGPLQAVGQPGHLRQVVRRVAPGEVDRTAQVVLADDLGGRRDAVLGDVALVGGVRVAAVDVGDEQLADLLLERHPVQRRYRQRAGRRLGGGFGCGGRDDSHRADRDDGGENAAARASMV